MIIEVDNVKGFRDFLPPESFKFKNVKEIIEKHFKLYGFLPIETSIIEYDEYLRGDSIEEDELSLSRFRLKDRVGRNLALRYDLSTAFPRILKQNPNLKLPLRVYQIGPSFRDDTVGVMRFRQFTQCDADIIGDSSVQAEIELLSLAQEILNELEIEFEILVNHKKLINSLIESVELQDREKVIRELANLEKLGEDMVKSNLKKYGNANQILTLFKLLEKDIMFFRINAFEGAEELINLLKECKKRYVTITAQPSLVKNVGYFSDFIFEIRQKGQKESLGFGGRYDNFVGKYLNVKMPAVGISFGLEKIALTSEKSFENKIVIIAYNSQKKDKINEIEKELREKKIPCFLLEDSFVNAVEYASYYKIPYVLFVDTEEKEKKKFKLRNVKSGAEKTLSMKQIIKELKN